MSFKKVKHFMYAIATCMVFTICFFGASIVSDAATVGWYKDSHGWYYYYSESSYYTDGIYEISGNKYCFDEEGYMCTGLINRSGYVYYADSNGVLQSGWQKIDGDYYYFDLDMKMDKWIDDTYYVGKDGKLASNKLAMKSGTRYFIGEDGKIDCTIGWKQTTPYYEGDIVSTSYVVDEYGTLADGWLKISGKWYYFSDGLMYYDTHKLIDGDYYYFAPSGVMVTGWYNRGSDEYPMWSYSDENGRMYNGWIQSCGEWYFCSNGYTVSGWEYIDGQDYYFKPSGELVKGWYCNKSTDYYGRDTYQWIYTSPVNGAEFTGWVENSGNWYYIYNGYMVTGSAGRLIDGNYYYFKKNGEMVKGWCKASDISDSYSPTSGCWYYTDPDTGIEYDGWLQSGKDWYYINEGWMIRNDSSYEIDDKYYAFDESGRMIRGWYEYTDPYYENYSYWLYANPVTGELHNGWLQSGSDWYYIDDGYMEYDNSSSGFWAYDVSDKYYYFKPTGELILGWYEKEYYNSDGTKGKASIYTNPVTGERYTGWVQSGKDWYYVSNSTYIYKNGWSTVDDKSYYFDESGKMVLGWYKKEAYNGDGTKYSYWMYTNPINGERYTGWVKSGDDWYYISSSNAFYGGWRTVGDKSYYFDEEGRLVYGWYSYEYKYHYAYDLYETETRWIYTDPTTGERYTGWLQYGGEWYYINSGDMSYGGCYEIDDVYYYFNEDGTLVRGLSNWKRQVGYDEYVDVLIYTHPATGAEYTGWAKVGNNWYYAEESEVIVNTMRTIIDDTAAESEPNSKDYKTDVEYDKAYQDWYNNHTYIFTVGGALSKGGWMRYADDARGLEVYFYAKPDGTAYNGWLQFGGKYYYIEDGEMLTNCLTPDGYYVDVNGVWIQ